MVTTVSHCSFLRYVVPRRCFDEGFIFATGSCTILDVHVKTVRRYLRDGTVKGQKIGGSWKVSKEVLKDYLDNRAPESMEDVFEKIKGTAKVKTCLMIDIDVTSAKEANGYANIFMTLINSNEYEFCRFQYQLEDNVAKFMVCGSFNFLKDAINALEEEDMSYETD